MPLLGPYEAKSPDALDLEKMDQSFVSAVELADVALRLANLKGLKEPDVEGAIKLLRRTWKDRHHLTPLRCAGMLLVTDLRGMAVSAVSDPAACDKRFPGADQIEEPAEFPVTLDEALRFITGDYSRKRRMSYLLRMTNELRRQIGFSPLSAPAHDEEIGDASDFWDLAKNVAPFCPKFTDLYRGSKQVEGSPKSRKVRKVKKSS